MKFKIYLLSSLVFATLISCTPSTAPTPSQTPPSKISVPTITPIPSPVRTQTSLPTSAPTSTINPGVQRYLVGAEAFLPPGSEPLYNQAWIKSADKNFASSAYLPYRTEDGLSLLVMGQPRQADGSWNGREQVRIWDWQDTGSESRAWQEVRPVNLGQSSFLGLDQDGQWWAVISTIDWETPELILFGIFPVIDQDNVQVEAVGLYPAGEKPDDASHYFVRTNDRLMLFRLEHNQVNEVWSTDQVISGRFHVHSYAQGSGSVDMTGDGIQEILVVWDLSFPPVIDVYQMPESGSEVLRWLGRFDSSLQYNDVTGNWIPEFLEPDEREDVRAWQVTEWNGESFVAGETLFEPVPVSPSPIPIDNLEDLPSLPDDIIFYRGDNFSWWRRPLGGGLPEEITQPADKLSGDCAPYQFGGFGDACYSPAGRFKLVYVSAPIEGSYVGIQDDFLNNKVTLPDSFVYTVGYNTFGWSPDEKFLLFARGGGSARLVRVHPVSGEERTLLNPSLCGLDIWDCVNHGAEGITNPVVLRDGSLGFAFQSANPSLYPPPGIYRLSPQKELTMLVALPYIDESKGSKPNSSSGDKYGSLLWSPDRSMFLFYDLFLGDKSGVRTLLLGNSDGSALWDLREALPSARLFLWDD